MEVFGITYQLESVEEFWSEIDDILHPLDGRESEGSGGEHSDDRDQGTGFRAETVAFSIRTFISFCGQYLDSQFLREGDEGLDHAVAQLITSRIYNARWEESFAIVVDRLVGRTNGSGGSGGGQSSSGWHGATSACTTREKRVLLAVILADGQRQGKRAYKLLSRSKAVWSVLLSILQEARLHHAEEKARRRYSSGQSWEQEKMDLVLPCVRVLFEYCRVQRLTDAELALVDDGLVEELLEDIEETPGELYESFNVSTIKFLLALNEQFMVASVPRSDSGDKNRIRQAEVIDRGVVAVLRRRIGRSKTFGENIIFVLNRSVDPCLQLLILKLLYLLFTSGPDLAEFFYTNDLHVLLDVFIRELSDLPFEAESLRNTYLRVLPPLLTMTQLRDSSYKKAELARVLAGLARQCSYRDVNPTTLRLVERCTKLPWFQSASLAKPRPAQTNGHGIAKGNETDSSHAIQEAGPLSTSADWRPGYREPGDPPPRPPRLYEQSPSQRGSSASIDQVAVAAPKRVTARSNLTREYT